MHRHENHYLEIGDFVYNPNHSSKDNESHRDRDQILSYKRMHRDRDQLKRNRRCCLEKLISQLTEQRSLAKPDCLL